MPFFDDSLREKFHNLTGESDSSSRSERNDWEPVISIGTAAKMVGLSVSALRKYEKEGLLIFHRSDSGRRLLCRADLKRIAMIQHMINDIGLNIEGIRRLLALLPCWDLKACSGAEQDRCGVPQDSNKPCWMVRGESDPQQGQECRQCEVYKYGAYCAVTMKTVLHRIKEID